MAFAQSDLDVLDRVIASGVLVAKYADCSQVTFRNLDEAVRARGIVLGELRASGSQTIGNPRVSLATFE